MNLAVVIPTIREDCITRWMAEWEADLAGVRVIVVEDNPEPGFTLPGSVEHYAWRDIDAELGDDAWIIPRRNAAVRNYGFLKALQGDADLIWTLDDDCYPEPGRKGTYLQHWEGFFSAPPAPDDSWWNTIAPTGMFPRGYPYRIRETARPVVLHHGLWSGVPDLDGITQLAHPDFRLPPCQAREAVPSGKFFPMCIMNVVFRRELAPAMYQVLAGKDPQGKPWGFDRFDDIWAGLLAKKVIDHLGWACTSGAPGIYHSRASDPQRNAELEAAGMAAHEDFWPRIRSVRLGASTAAGCYQELAGAVEGYWGDSPRPRYWQDLARAMRLWARYTEQLL